jgi:hypothetical protein
MVLPRAGESPVPLMGGGESGGGGITS